MTDTGRVVFALIVVSCLLQSFSPFLFSMSSVVKQSFLFFPYKSFTFFHVVAAPGVVWVRIIWDLGWKCKGIIWRLLRFARNDR